MATNSKEVQRKADEKRRGSRARYWTVIVYPESAPADWRDVIDKEHIQWIESPLHDKDTNPDGEVKKAHWHLLLLYSGMKSYSQVKKLADNLNAPSPEVCSEARGLVRLIWIIRKSINTRSMILKVMVALMLVFILNLHRVSDLRSLMKCVVGSAKLAVYIIPIC